MYYTVTNSVDFFKVVNYLTFTTCKSIFNNVKCNFVVRNIYIWHFKFSAISS